MSLNDEETAAAAAYFISELPHQKAPYSKRNWGTPLHSLCSYRGKLKPSIAHFLVRDFTKKGDVILDPFSGVGTIPLEARLQERNAIAGDLSPLAHTVSLAKLAELTEATIAKSLSELSESLSSIKVSTAPEHFGLNGPISSYFHEDTLAEILKARQYFLTLKKEGGFTGPDAFIESNLLHILHGNRPYALSRRSHPLTPYSPTGAFEYKNVVEHLTARVDRFIPFVVGLSDTSTPGRALQSDFRELDVEDGTVDSVITSPPFSDSFRFWSTNWMRLWFAGWDPEQFRSEPPRYLESEQKSSFAVYSKFFKAMAGKLRPGGLMILHLGAGKNKSMAEAIEPHMTDDFRPLFLGSESVQNGETLGLRDHGSTHSHNYLFLRRR